MGNGKNKKLYLYRSDNIPPIYEHIENTKRKKGWESKFAYLCMKGEWKETEYTGNLQPICILIDKNKCDRIRFLKLEKDDTI